MGRLSALIISIAITVAALPQTFVRAQYRDAQSAGQSSGQEQNLGRVFKSYQRLQLDAARAADGVRRDGLLSLKTPNGPLNLKLAPYDLRAPNYKAVKMTAGGVEQPLTAMPVTTYRGEVLGQPDAEARFTIDENHLEGLILMPHERFYVEPMRNYDAQAEADAYILYRASDVLDKEGSATSAITLNHKVNRALAKTSYAPTTMLMPQTGTTLRQVELATEADYDYVLKLGSAGAANKEILTVMNQVDAIYRKELGLTFRVVFQSAWDTPADPYSATDLVGMLNEFTNYWNANRTNVARDLAHMWTGKETGGVGVSWLGTVCLKPNFAYGISPFVVRDQLNPVQEFALTAHEIGHSFNATHSDSDASCANTIMNTIATSSTQLTFCQRSRDEISTFVNANSGCLTVVTAVGTPTVSLSASSYTINEGDPLGVVTILINRIGDVSTATSVDYTTSDISGTTPCQTNGNGIASERCDYATAVGTLRFAAGEVNKSVSIPIINDAYVEPNETFNFTLKNPQGGNLGAISTATITIVSNDTQAATTNPIDSPDFFIRQQYIDFLGRQPEPAGFQFWMNRLTSCAPGDTTCDRIDTSMRFFQSDEFQERGFYVYRLYDAVLGRLPLYAEFVPDVARLNGTQTVAEQRQSKDAYLLDFVNRQEFRARYGQYLSSDGLRALDPTGFVNALTATAGITPSNRSTLISNLQSGARDVPHTLEDFILAPELSNVGTKFYDRGFITMQYFGYLRRDPEATGFNFWVSQLIGPNAPHKGDYRFMVGGFLQSDEYRFRFALISAS